MCNLYRMRASVDELRGVFGAFEGDTDNLPSFVAIYPDCEAPVLRHRDGALALDQMT